MAVPRQWKGETAVLIASGPSLTPDDVNYCQNKARVVVINDNYRLAPWADLLYAADGPWWHEHKGVPEFQGQKWTQDDHAARKFGLNYIACKYQPGISHDSSVIHAGFNSGFQALNLVYLMGVKRVILLGFDMKLGKSGKKHWFGDHPAPLNKNFHATRWADCMDKVARRYEKAGVVVINASRETALKEYRRAKLADCL